MKAKQFFFPGTHPAGVEPPREVVKVDDELMQQLKARAAKLPIEGELASFAGATGWINSDPLSPADLRGKVVLVDFWTFTCVNWLRTFPYVRAWAEKYGDKGLVVIGVHTPEFPFEGDIDNVRKQAKALGSNTQSRSTPTTGSGGRSTTTTGRRSTSRMARDGSEPI